MKLPALAITAAFACGIALGLWPPIARLSTSRFYLAAGFLAAAFFTIVALFLLNRARCVEAAVVSGVAWILLGVVGAWISEQPLPRTHVMRLIETGAIDLHTPLRWHGTLKDEPAKLPWGFGLEIKLAGVDYENTCLAAVGGMRVSFSPRPEDVPLPLLHAGDEVTVHLEERVR